MGARYFLREQFGRVSHSGPFAKSRFLKAAWMAGAPVGVSLPLVARRLPAPHKLINDATGLARRSVAARLFVGDIGAYSGNWDITRRYVPRRACAHCFWVVAAAPFIEDEWHVFCVCPLYHRLRSRLPFRAEEIVTEGHALQGDGCTPRNLQALARAVMSSPDFTVIVDFLLQALKERRQFRERNR